jgi:PhnB protein
MKGATLLKQKVCRDPPFNLSELPLVVNFKTFYFCIMKQKMPHINAYLTFNGNCREAMTFYRDCLGGELNFQTIGESPMSEQMPQEMKNSILHSTLVKDDMVLMASDMVGEMGLVKGNAVSLILYCGNEPEIRDFYKKLSTGGQATYPLEDTFWGALFGSLTDKFGNPWLLHFDKNKE